MTSVGLNSFLSNVRKTLISRIEQKVRLISIKSNDKQEEEPIEADRRPEREENWRWVVGNEAADLDSIISSISFSYLQTKLLEQYSDKPQLLIPLINLPRQDIHLRPEVKYVLEVCKVPYEDLLFIDDPIVARWESLTSKPTHPGDLTSTLPKYNFILMDHNKLHSKFQSWPGIVEAIYDHHQDEKHHLGASPRNIQQVGSNTSLIVQWWQAQCKNYPESIVKALYPDLARLMLAPILVDTVNLKGEYGRVTDCDLEMADYLTSIIHSQAPTTDFPGRDEYFKEIDVAKTNVAHMTSEQLLRKDFKLWVISPTNLRLGMSTIVNWCYVDWQARAENSSEDPFTSMRTFSEQYQLDVLVVLGSKQYQSGDSSHFERELYLYSPHPNLFSYLHSRLTTDSRLGLRPIDNQQFLDRGYAFHHQSVTSASRKVSYPILKELLESSKL